MIKPTRNQTQPRSLLSLVPLSWLTNKPNLSIGTKTSIWMNAGCWMLVPWKLYPPLRWPAMVGDQLRDKDPETWAKRRLWCHVANWKGSLTFKCSKTAWKSTSGALSTSKEMVKGTNLFCFVFQGNITHAWTMTTYCMHGLICVMQIQRQIKTHFPACIHLVNSYAFPNAPVDSKFMYEYCAHVVLHS